MSDLSNILETMILFSDGRHRLYAACRHPMRNRLRFAGRAEFDLVPEESFWTTVVDTARRLGHPGCLGYHFGTSTEFWDDVSKHPVLFGSIREAFLALTDAIPDPNRTPPHPLVEAV